MIEFALFYGDQPLLKEKWTPEMSRIFLAANNVSTGNRDYDFLRFASSHFVLQVGEPQLILVDKNKWADLFLSPKHINDFPPHMVPILRAIQQHHTPAPVPTPTERVHYCAGCTVAPKDTPPTAEIKITF